MRRASITIGIRRYVGGETDAHGNPVDTWAAEVPLSVYAVAPAGSDEPGVGRDLVVDDLDIYTPAVEINPRDRLMIEGEAYNVEGRPANYNRGPYGARPGVVIRVQRVEG